MGLTKWQEGVLIGTLLGDGCLELNGSKVRLRIDHSDKQKEYVKWKYSVFSNVAAKKPRSVSVFDKRTNKVYQHWRFDTRSMHLFDKYRQMFYKKSIKGLPRNIKHLLKNSLVLAVWFMDDGYLRKDCRALHINTQAYSVLEQKMLQECLMDNLGIKTNIHKQTGKYKLYIPSAESEKFCSLIKRFIIPSMRHKLL